MGSSKTTQQQAGLLVGQMHQDTQVFSSHASSWAVEKVKCDLMFCQ